MGSFIGILLLGIIIGIAIGYFMLKASVLSGNLPKDEIEKRYILRELYTEKSDSLNEKGIEMKKAAETIINLNIELSSLKEKEKALNEKIASFNVEMQEMHDRSHEQFQNIATKILDDNTRKFTDLNKEKMDSILKPLGEKVVEFRQKVEEESKERNTLKGVIQNLMEMSRKMNDETVNLTKALKGDSKMQGDWGEMILENILEKSGLRKGHEYSVQESLTTETGQKLRPDIIISYPDNKKAIIDSKVSLNAYARYINSQSQEEQQSAIKEHINSIQKHINDLSEKNYQKYVPSLDFVMMFVPIEFALSLALQNNPELWNYAYNKRVLLISPTHLIVVLKLIEDLWKRETQNKNAKEIARRGTSLYEKLILFVESLTDIGKSLDKAQESYSIARGRLKDGKGSLIGQARELEALGIKSEKKIPTDLLPEITNSEELDAEK